MIKREGNHCWDCKHSTSYIHQGEEYYELNDKIECNNDKVSVSYLEVLEWDLEKAGKQCSEFSSEKFKESCYQCGKLVEGLISSWKYWVLGDIEDHIACSKECMNAGQNAIDAQIEAHEKMIEEQRNNEAVNLNDLPF